LTSSEVIFLLGRKGIVLVFSEIFNRDKEVILSFPLATKKVYKRNKRIYRSL